MISCGAGNVYGHPAEVVLERLDLGGSLIYRTDHDGCIIFEEKRGGEITAVTMCDADG